MTRLIERYRAYMSETTKKELAFRVIPQFERLATEMSLECTLTGLTISEKYLFSQSALLFHKEMLDQRLRASGSGNVSWKAKLPTLPIWLEGEGTVIETGNMQAQGLFLNNHYHPEVLKRSKIPLVHDPEFREMLETRDEWYCDLVGIDGKPVFSLTVSSEGDWIINDWTSLPVWTLHLSQSL
jgi:hypothetical protein